MMNRASADIEQKVAEVMDLAFEKRDFEGALRICDELIERFPDNARGYQKKAAVLHHSGASIEALTEISRAIEIDPNRSYQFSLRGRIRFETSDFLGPIDDFSRVIEIENQTKSEYFLQTAYAFRAASSLSIGKFDDVAKDLRKVKGGFVTYTRTGVVSEKAMMNQLKSTGTA